MRRNRLLLLPLILAVFLLGLVRDIAVHEDALLVHTICPEHGELIHAGTPASKQSELTTAPSSAPHQACQLADLGNLPVIEGPPAPAYTAPLRWSPVATHRAPRAPPTVRSPLIVAPKTSPPMG